MKWSGISADAITNSKLDEQVTIDQYGAKIESKSTQIDIVALIFFYIRVHFALQCNEEEHRNDREVSVEDNPPKWATTTLRYRLVA